MNDKPNNIQSIPTKPANKAQGNVCERCKVNPCICPDKNGDPIKETLGEETKSKEHHPRTKPPKICWI